MKLSIIIVNYNVKYFLRQLLHSIYASHFTFNWEIIVVDNASTDDSVNFLRREFPGIKLIANAVNYGFSRANNMAIRQCSGEYVLLLNPDTVLQEDTLEKCVRYMDSSKEVGALGCRMIDGSGHFLPESKRGFPGPRVALFKTLGLNSLFPRSRFLNEYYLGHLPEHEINEVDVLTGAFMLIPKSVLEKTGLLDEDFFMYGEDIDLSYRIRKNGHKIIYFPETTIIHFKGESTTKNSVQYIRRFYGAMQIFAKKHYSGQKAFFLRTFLQIGIFVKAFAAALVQLLHRILPALIDFVLVSILLRGISQFWAIYYFGNPDYYARSPLQYQIMVYALIWVTTIYFSGGYDRVNWRRLWRGILVGWFVIALIYGFLDDSMRTSRFQILVAGPLVWMLLSVWRTVSFRIFRKRWPWEKEEARIYAVVGSSKQAEKIHLMLEKSRQPLQFAGFISEAPSERDRSFFLGELHHLDQIVRFHKLKEIIFCSSANPASEMMYWMTKLGPDIRYKIAPEETTGIIGSHSKDSSGELYTFDIKYNLSEPYGKRNKRMFDIITAVILILFSPVFIWFFKNKRSFFRNCFQVLKGEKTWVSYAGIQSNQIFPALKPGVIGPDLFFYREDYEQALQDADYFYAVDYTIRKDIYLIFSKWKNLGN